MADAEMILTLKPITAADSGETVSGFPLSPDQPCLIGRSAEADWPVPHASVSRRHATVERKGDSWFLTDHSSRHGTSINDRRIESGSPVMIQPGDVLAFGAWRCRCVSGPDRPSVTTPFAPAIGVRDSVSAIAPEQLSGVAQRGLDVLMDLTAQLDVADDRKRVSEAVVKAVQEATRCRRVVIVEPETDDELVVLASTTGDAPKVSRSLIEQASRHGLVQHTVDGGQSQQAQSIIDLGIRSAICAPILVANLPCAFMMIDTRDTEGVVPADAAAFCHAVSRLAGLAFERISAASMADRHRQLEADLDAARRAQELLSPPTRGRHGTVSYHFESIPGRVVAGDLFDIFALDESRAAFFLGDVSGKGVGAAMLMAACQSQLRTQLLSGADLASAMAAVNADLHQRTDASKFVTLLGGVINVQHRTVQLADAGHGLCVLAPNGGQPHRIDTTPGFPLGVVEEADYEMKQLDLESGSSLVFFSDGAVEQANPEGSQHGLEGVLACLGAAHDADSLVESLLSGVRAHAAGPLADDLTVAAIWID